MSRWSTWSKGSEHKEKRGFSAFMKEDPQRMGNPAANSGGPAERAAAFGLQSDGSGNYIDPKTGQKVATTVNNELVFIDNNRATGGAISDSSGGAALTQAAPSWVDPMTGMVTVPPAQPESPEEISAVPDATPATAPKGYDAFMNKKKDQAYAMGAGGPEAFSQGTPEIGLDAQPGSINPIGGMGGPDLAPTMGEDYLPQDLAKRDVNRPVTPQERVQTAKKVQQVKQPKRNFRDFVSQERQKELNSRLDKMNSPSNLPTGAGANLLSLDDIGKFRNYIKNGPQNQTEDVSDDDLEYAMGYLKDTAGKKWTGFQNRLKGKGDPSPDRKVVSRAREIVGSYLRNLGQSSIDGEDLPFSESELDHGVSLSNGGEDIDDNWRWLPKRYNQFKGDLDDDALLAALDKEEARQNDPDFKIKSQENDLTNFTRSEWKDRFDTNGWENMNVADIREKKGTQGMQFLKALAEKAGVSYYKNREGPRASGRAGGGTSLGVEELQDRLIDQLGIPDTVDVENFDRGLFELLDRIEDKRSDLDSAKRARRKEKRAERLTKKK